MQGVYLLSASTVSKIKPSEINGNEIKSEIVELNAEHFVLYSFVVEAHKAH